jgi:NTP pyrophosphatase (non-canonical NTP hydrolase)
MTEMPAPLLRVLTDVANERDAQDCWFGEQNHEPEVWLAILTEEVGELTRAMLAARFPQYQHGKCGTMRDEAVQVAAVAVAFVEYLDRREVQR